jgi:hypothetical protein
VRLTTGGGLLPVLLRQEIELQGAYRLAMQTASFFRWPNGNVKPSKVPVIAIVVLYWAGPIPVIQSGRNSLDVKKIKTPYPGTSASFCGEQVASRGNMLSSVLVVLLHHSGQRRRCFRQAGAVLEDLAISTGGLARAHQKIADRQLTASKCIGYEPDNRHGYLVSNVGD